MRRGICQPAAPFPELAPLTLPRPGVGYAAACLCTHNADADERCDAEEQLRDLEAANAVRVARLRGQVCTCGACVRGCRRCYGPHE